MSDNDLPDVLYHYTDIHALKGIWENGEFWATESFYLNDTTELALGLASIRVALAERQAALYDELLAGRDVDALDLEELRYVVAEAGNQREPFRAAERLVKDFEEFPLSFVVSLSENRDQLSQWRAYARAGYCLGFSTELLQSSITGHRELRRVSYQEEDKRQLADSIIDKVTELRARLKDNKLWDSDDDEEDPDSIRDFYAQTIIATEAAFFKDRSFAEEAEVRLVETNVGPDFHWPNQYGMTPRKKFPIPSEALMSVTVGPGPHMEQRVRSLTSYFLDGKFKGEESWSGKRPTVLKSGIPFRDW